MVVLCGTGIAAARDRWNLCRRFTICILAASTVGEGCEGDEVLKCLRGLLGFRGLSGLRRLRDFGGLRGQMG